MFYLKVVPQTHTRSLISVAKYVRIFSKIHQFCCNLIILQCLIVYGSIWVTKTYTHHLQFTHLLCSSMFEKFNFSFENYLHHEVRVCIQEWPSFCRPLIQINHKVKQSEQVVCQLLLSKQSLIPIWIKYL